MLENLLNRSFQIQIPVTQSAGNYLLLCVYLVDPILRFRFQQDYQLAIPWWQYLLLAFADVEGNFLVVCAYKYTSISSVMLLDCFTIPIVMLLSTAFLQAKYKRSHYVAVLFCLVGIIVLVISDSLQEEETTSWNVSTLYGDFLCLLGSAVYACSNVGQEYLVKKENRRIEFLGFVGLFGFSISSMQAAYFEGDVIRAVDWTWSSALCLLGYIGTLFIMYSAASIFLTTGDAAVFNLSLLTSDFFAVVAAKYLFDEELSGLYFVGFVFIFIGVIIYNRSTSPITVIGNDILIVQDSSVDRLLPAEPHTENITRVFII
ncbi:solute carrier family 35 member f2 [Plasmopara halstedii]|uniref:Solute carrier family 35 member f2 n=1 Tax=Plasmopara halstedii TaxID=4781 RepID=A0A0P1AUD3_PLAHL|nr:solute carrier family 35 member f2 [Plasmopara halstedii]CEG44727.1 solute carrier family 35 member f2 [Plasmopara halstedii]|eukprot:XP_024581096.1 solute carrier family 35 member f2 [Plasmopara halstedii]